MYAFKSAVGFNSICSMAESISAEVFGPIALTKECTPEQLSQLFERAALRLLDTTRADSLSRFIVPYSSVIGPIDFFGNASTNESDFSH